MNPIVDGITFVIPHKSFTDGLDVSLSKALSRNFPIGNSGKETVYGWYNVPFSWNGVLELSKARNEKGVVFGTIRCVSGMMQDYPSLWEVILYPDQTGLSAVRAVRQAAYNDAPERELVYINALSRQVHHDFNGNHIAALVEEFQSLGFAV